MLRELTISEMGMVSGGLSLQEYSDPNYIPKNWEEAWAMQDPTVAEQMLGLPTGTLGGESGFSDGCLSSACERAQQWINDNQASLDTDRQAILDSLQRIAIETGKGASAGRWVAGIVGVPIGAAAGFTAGVIGEGIRAGSGAISEL